MDKSVFALQASDDFDRARTKQLFSKIFSILKNQDDDLLSFSDVQKILKPKAEHYKGLKTVPVALIAGSEGRYQDFNKLFLPKHQNLAGRWKSVDMAHYMDVNLPPVSLYEIGGVYFVKDGNHRISVAIMKGIDFVDAEVTHLSSEINLKPDMTREDLKKAVINFEKKKFYASLNLKKIIPNAEIDFTAPGRYDELITHINCHKYYLNLDKSDEISMREAILSWYVNIYLKIAKIIQDENLLSRFPHRTEADLCIWIVKHWDNLKRKYGSKFPVEKAIKDFSKKYGKNLLQRITTVLKRIFRRLKN